MNRISRERKELVRMNYNFENRSFERKEKF